MLERRNGEFDLVRARYGEIQFGSDLDWVIIKRYRLPPGWNMTDTPVLVIIRPGYPTVPPDSFYVDNGLRLANGQDPSNTSRNQHQLGQLWLMFSYHVDGAEWKPHPDLLEGHNLLTYILGVERRLSEAN